jgi:hypothetical protein
MLVHDLGTIVQGERKKRKTETANYGSNCKDTEEETEAEEKNAESKIGSAAHTGGSRSILS